MIRSLVLFATAAVLTGCYNAPAEWRDYAVCKVPKEGLAVRYQVQRGLGGDDVKERLVWERSGHPQRILAGPRFAGWPNLPLFAWNPAHRTVSMANCGGNEQLTWNLEGVAVDFDEEAMIGAIFDMLGTRHIELLHAEQHNVLQWFCGPAGVHANSQRVPEDSAAVTQTF